MDSPRNGLWSVCKKCLAKYVWQTNGIGFTRQNFLYCTVGRADFLPHSFLDRTTKKWLTCKISAQNSNFLCCCRASKGRGSWGTPLPPMIPKTVRAWTALAALIMVTGQQMRYHRIAMNHSSPLVKKYLKSIHIWGGQSPKRQNPLTFREVRNSSFSWFAPFVGAVDNFCLLAIRCTY